MLTEHRDYDGHALDPAAVDPDPLRAVAAWLEEARRHGVVEPEAMTVSTVDEHGRPASRYVLLRGIYDRGLAFFTSYASDKARALAGDPHCALTLGWLELHRSVRVEGVAERLPAAESDAYFAGRPRASRIGAWASPQSSVLASRDELDARVAEAEQRFAGVLDIPRPEDWGGFLVVPERVELWQGRPSRLHDRVRYERDAGGAWSRVRLAP
ncbi:MAG: pyridoxamine 5'-phosphate oxidase [Solirubrobacteraceae bacterium]